MLDRLTTPATMAPAHWACPIAQAELRAILEGGCGAGVRAMTLLDEAGYPRLSAPGQGPALRPGGINTAEAVRAIVSVRGVIVATVCADATPGAEAVAEQSAHLVAGRIADAWRAAQEIDSLSGEIVHVYEELYLLYDLGEALTGQLTVAQVAEVILSRCIHALGAAWGELHIANGADAQHYCYPQQFGVAVQQRADTAHRLGAEIRTGGQPIGRLTIVRAADGEPFSSSEIKLLDAVGAYAGNALHNAQRYQDVRRLADTDALTGLANHRAVQEALDGELAKAAAQGYPLGLILIDLDDFKLFNDTYGHLVGDQILRAISGTLMASSRTRRDLAGRYGGDEFIMVLPGTDRDGTEAVARRILETTRANGIQIGAETIPIAVSLGCAVYPDDALLKNDLLSHADSALYEVKRRGGDGALAVQPGAGGGEAAAAPNTTFGALQGLVNAVDAKDRYTRDHSETVTEYAILLAQQLRLSAEVCSALRVAGLLHDIGKIGIPDQILRKPGRLNSDEYRIMQQHVTLSEMIIKEVPYLVDVLSAVASHHERYDGCGYPRGLAGEEIPLMGRIMALADACSAMLLDRPYRKGLPWDAVVAELRHGKGTQFDPALVEPFIAAMENAPLHEHLLGRR